MQPMIPGIAPSTGVVVDGGGSGKMHLRHGVRPGITVVVTPSNSLRLPWSKGVRVAMAALFMMYLVG